MLKAPAGAATPEALIEAFLFPVLLHGSMRSLRLRVHRKEADEKVVLYLCKQAAAEVVISPPKCQPPGLECSHEDIPVDIPIHARASNYRNRILCSAPASTHFIGALIGDAFEQAAISGFNNGSEPDTKVGLPLHRSYTTTCVIMLL